MGEKEKIVQCVLNYVDGWYEGNPSRMKLALSKYLVKRRVVSENEIWDINKEWMINATTEGKGKIDTTKKAYKKVKILDKTEKMATVKLLSNEFTDYLHLIKCNESWEIVNVLCDFRK